MENKDQSFRRLLTPEQLAAIDSFPQIDEMESRIVPGGITVSYLKKTYIIERLHAIFGMEFVKINSSDLAVISNGETVSRARDEKTKEFKTVRAYHAVFSCRVEIEITIPKADGTYHTFSVSAYGTDSQIRNEVYEVLPINETLEVACKGANTNALKRAAEQLGRTFGLDLKSAPTGAKTGSTGGGFSMANMSGISQATNKKEPENKNAEKEKTQPAEPAKEKNKTQTSSLDLTSGISEAAPIETKEKEDKTTQTDWKAKFLELWSTIKEKPEKFNEVCDELADIKNNLDKESEKNQEILKKWISEITGRIVQAKGENSEEAELLKKAGIL